MAPAASLGKMTQCWDGFEAKPLAIRIIGILAMAKFVEMAQIKDSVKFSYGYFFKKQVGYRADRNLLGSACDLLKKCGNAVFVKNEECGNENLAVWNKK